MHHRPCVVATYLTATGCTGRPLWNAPTLKWISALPLVQVPSGKRRSGRFHFEA